MRRRLGRLLNWLFCGISFGDWKWYPDPWKENERNLGMKIEKPK